MLQYDREGGEGKKSYVGSEDTLHQLRRRGHLGPQARDCMHQQSKNKKSGDRQFLPKFVTKGDKGTPRYITHCVY